MTRIGLLSDTHGDLHPRIFNFFADCDEIWHAGDIGDLELAERLAAFKKFRAVYGNIDNHDIRKIYQKDLIFTVESLKVFITHIGGYPQNYARGVEQIIRREKPGLFISGHSHILKILPDKKNGLLHINPGAAGNHGFHHFITFVRFVVDGAGIDQVEIKEIERNRLV